MHFKKVYIAPHIGKRCQISYLSSAGALYILFNSPFVALFGLQSLKPKLLLGELEMKKICIHDYDKRYVRDTKRKEENKNVSKKNKELVFKFCDACLLNDMSKARITKYLSFFCFFFKHFNKDLDKATREDIEKFVAVINAKENFSPYTKHDTTMRFNAAGNTNISGFQDSRDDISIYASEYSHAVHDNLCNNQVCLCCIELRCRKRGKEGSKISVISA